MSIGYSAFLGIGAYTTVLLSLRGVDPFLTLPLGAIIAAAFSFVIIGLPAFRLRGPYFTIATIGVGEAVRVFASSVSFTGGSSGLRMPAGSFDFNLNYFSMVVLAILVVALAAYIKRSAFGRALAAIRQDIDAAEALGVNSTRVKLAAHALSAALVSRRRRPLRDQLPVHRSRLRLRLPAEPLDRADADRRRRRHGGRTGPRRDHLQLRCRSSSSRSRRCATRTSSSTAGSSSS